VVKIWARRKKLKKKKNGGAPNKHVLAKTGKGKRERRGRDQRKKKPDVEWGGGSPKQMGECRGSRIK